MMVNYILRNNILLYKIINFKNKYKLSNGEFYFFKYILYIK